MKSRRPVFLFLILCAVAAGCAPPVPYPRYRRPTRPRLSCQMLMVYGGGLGTIPENEPPMEEAWIKVYVELSDSGYVFGEINPDGTFSGLVDEQEGVFRTRGGELKDFAIRGVDEDGGEGEVYTAAHDGSCELTGPALRAARALYPVLEEPYYPIVRLTFDVPREDPVTAELTTTAPNGFTESR